MPRPRLLHSPRVNHQRENTLLSDLHGSQRLPTTLHNYLQTYPGRAALNIIELPEQELMVPICHSMAAALIKPQLDPRIGIGPDLSPANYGEVTAACSGHIVLNC